MNEQIVVSRGELWYADLGKGEGSIQSSKRPVIITSNQTCNKFSGVIHVVPITSSLHKKKLPTHVDIPESCGVDKYSIALVEQEMPLNKFQLIHKIGLCNRDIMIEINEAIKIQHAVHEKNEPIDLQYINRLLYLINEAAERESRYNDDYFTESKQAHTFELKKYLEKYDVNYNAILGKRKINTLYFTRNGVVING